MSDGVSEVVGAMVLVAIAGLAVAILLIVFLANPLPTNVPSFTGLISNSSKTIYISNEGGDPLLLGRSRILVDGIDQTYNFTKSLANPGNPFSLGMKMNYTATSMPKRVVVVFNTSWGGGTVLLSADLAGTVTLTAPGGGSGGCTAAYVQSNSAHSSGSAISLTLTFGSPTAAGDLVVVGMELDTNAPVRVHLDCQGRQWGQLQLRYRKHVEFGECFHVLSAKRPGWPDTHLPHPLGKQLTSH